MSAVPVVFMTSPLIRLWFPDTDPVNGPLMHEFLKVAHANQADDIVETFEETLSRSINTAIRNLGLPFCAQIDLSNGAICLMLDVNDTLKIQSPSVMLH